MDNAGSHTHRRRARTHTTATRVSLVSLLAVHSLYFACTLQVDNDGIGVLVKAIQAGHLPLLNWVDLSGNPASNKFEVLEALNSRNEKEHEKKRSERAAQGISSSTESLIYTRFTLAPMCEFRIVPLDDMDADPNDEDD